MPRLSLPALLLIAMARPLAAQEPASEVELKDPGTAKRYAFYFSGAGHFYTGESLRGGIMLGVSAVGLYKLVDALACSAASDVLFADTGCSRGTALLWLGLTFAPYIYGIIDAPKSAARVNARRLTQAKKLSFAPTLDIDRAGRFQAGIRLRIRH